MNDKPVNPALVPDTLTVIMVDPSANNAAIIHENEWRPYDRRTVQIKLTDEQRRQLKPRCTGVAGSETSYESVLQTWLEPASEPMKG